MKYKYFNPEEIIRKYFYEYVISEHNETSFHAYHLRKSIENLRNLILKHFSLQGYIVAFIPNISYAYQLIKKFVNSSCVESVLIHHSNPVRDFDFSKLEKSQGTCNHVHLEALIYRDDYSGINFVDFLTLDPSISFGIYGVIVFIFRQNFSIKPIYAGSSYTKGLPHSLECGTQNYANLLLLEAYFDTLYNHKHTIYQYISKKTTVDMYLINFNEV